MQRVSNREPDPRIAALRARGLRLTPQRLAVLDAAREVGGHQTADAIFARVRATHPYVSRVTIYRALAWLKGQGLVSETDLGGGQIEYEPVGARRHHHLVCLRCGVRQEFPDDLVAPLDAALRARYGFAPRIDHLALFGLCRECQGAAGATTPPAADA